ncbi:RNAse P Rpr2/Rpp21/SNM1 subunit domain-containing protein [Podospora didyma]|uniref:RNAse P Rpr2/Rpp21/SNM1 subunit domain-containing protein n=1 Tax=Podospora didyma TaxID=330526 RepID=A0AAE0P4B8_9PEZI|nr:RNAse P Rpr2/Rpp21/SNM1 subunit domain-containing protein [Podospora didyma]
MAKGKSNGGVQNRAIYSRVSFLQQAATFLASSPSPSTPQQLLPSKHDTVATASTAEPRPGPSHDLMLSYPLQGMGRRLATDLRSVSLKTRIRLSPAVKRHICKFCDSVLIEGDSCTSTIENKSKGGKKPWADALVRKCHTCGRERRYPVDATRPKRKGARDVPAAGTLPQKQTEDG